MLKYPSCSNIEQCKIILTQIRLAQHKLKNKSVLCETQNRLETDWMNIYKNNPKIEFKQQQLLLNSIAQKHKLNIIYKLQLNLDEIRYSQKYKKFLDENNN
jgi:hypothetical protein